MVFGDRRWRSLSIHWPGRSISARRFSGRLNHFASKRPIWLAEAADPLIARSPTTQRIAGSWHSRLASLTSSYPASRPNTAWRNNPANLWRPFLTSTTDSLEVFAVEGDGRLTGSERVS